MCALHQKSWIDRTLSHVPLQKPNKHIIAPEDALKSESVQEFVQPGGYENILRATEMLSRYLFAYATSNQDAKTNATVIIMIKTRHGNDNHLGQGIST